MKTSITLLVFFITSICFAQNGINYKAVIKDGSGNLIDNSQIAVQFNILKGIAQTNVYSEIHEPTTDDNGIIVVNIGEGNLISGSPDFTNIEWGNDTHFLNVLIDKSDGFVDMGTTEFKAVPYAKHSETTGNLNWTQTGNNIANNNSERVIVNSSSSNPLSIRTTNNINFMSFSNSNGYKGYSGIFSDVNDLEFGTGFGNETGNAHLVTQAIPRLTIDAEGKVGVNSSSPSSQFEVVLKDGSPTPENSENTFSITNAISGSSWQYYVYSEGPLSLSYNGDFLGYFDHTNGTYNTFSDRSLKKDITSLENGILDKIMELNPVSYLIKNQVNTKRSMGLISQEVQNIFPSITNYLKEPDVLTLSYSEFIPLLIKALQEQQLIIDKQNSQIDNVENDLMKLSKQLENLEVLNN
ncbi:tail fiber domain-containing protein [Algibacter sp. L1A34]|uniref:tail fiber domain-containing protein n=1 Tax=Algibacter sp. L1A34 TaxID=2686365 RepID=UPI00131C63B0|nr:tail fiber domain-containing protein [Algibacter sp. L1A34]